MKQQHEIDAISGASSSKEEMVKSSKDFEELYKTFVSSTKAAMRTNTHNLSQNIVHVKTPDISCTSAPIHICCVIDVSGSMQIDAACKDENGLENNTGLSN
eukprot:7026693-Ditylum_brightwellii.AAC.2